MDGKMNLATNMNFRNKKISQNKTLGTKITIDSSLNCTLQLKPIYNRNNKIIN